jgi:hypothetical protein
VLPFRLYVRRKATVVAEWMLLGTVVARIMVNTSPDGCVQPILEECSFFILSIATGAPRQYLSRGIESKMM